MSQSKNTRRVFGGLTVTGSTNLLNSRLSGVAEPITNSDAATKNYVDTSVLASNLQGGVGITISDNSVNVNNSQTTITAIGTLQTGVWNASMISIPYGGTGQTTFSTNQLVYYAGSNSLESTSRILYDTNYLHSSIPIIISNTTDTASINNTIGALVINGGVTIAKQLYVNSDAKFGGNVTVGNITVNGSLTLNTVNATNAIYTNVSTSSLNSSVVKLISFLVTPLTSTSNLIVTNTSSANFTSLSNTFANAIFTNLTSGTLNVQGVSILNSANITNISTGVLNSTNATITSMVGTSISTGTLKASVSVSTSNLTANSSTISNLYIPTRLDVLFSNLVNITSTNGNIINITSSNLTSVNSTITNSILTNVSTSNFNVSGTVNSSTISSGNLYVSSTLNVPNINNTNIVSTNLTVTNSISSFSTIGSLKVPGNTVLSNTVYNIGTATSLFINNSLTSTFNNFVGLTVANAHITGLGIFSTTQSVSTSTGILYSDNHITNNCSIGTLNVSGNINSSSGTITTSIITASNLYSSGLLKSLNVIATNTSSVNLFVTNETVSNSLITNISASTLNTSSIINTLHLNTTNSTSVNLVNTNISTSNIQITTASIGNNYTVNNTVANIRITNEIVTNSSISNVIVSTDAHFNKSLILNGNYQGGIIATAGSFLTILPSTYTNNISSSGGSVNSWYSNYISAPTLTATNISITTQKAANIYIESNVILGANQNITSNAALALGYISNSSGSNINGQIMFERSDGNWYTSMYVQNSTNRLIIANGNFSGGAGVGVNTVTNTPFILNNIISSNDTTETPYIQLLNTTSNFYSTVDSTYTSTGSLVLAGGLGVSKTIVTNSFALGYQLVTPSEAGTVIISANYTGVVIKLSASLSALTLTLPVVNVPDGKIIFITTNQNITTVTLTNTILTSSTMSNSIPLRFLYVKSDNIWYSI